MGFCVRARLQRGRARAGAESALVLLLAAQQRNREIAIACALRIVLSKILFCQFIVKRSLLRVYDSASAGRIFRITSPLAGSVVKEHQRLKPHNTTRRAWCRAIQAR